MGDDERWAAIETRDASADGSFLYGVVTTGVYCRPSCPSRRCRRENVRFFESAADAERSGLRPCRRCDPTGPGLRARRAALVARACRIIEESESAPDLGLLAQTIGMSPHHFHRVFKAEVGVTPKAYADASRARRVRDRLGGDASVTDVIYAAGFGSSRQFYASSTERLGMTPSKFRSGAVDVPVIFAVGECSLGAVLVAATPNGVCAIEFGDDPTVLVHQLQDRFHAARLTGGDADFDSLVARVIALVEDPTAGVDLPLDIQGTAFQERVWRALRDVPAGVTVTYADIAQRIGSPAAVRAVAGACAANHLAVAVPCHRVIRTDGTISGYRWGVERKAALLHREAAAPDVRAPSTDPTVAR